MNKSDIFSWFTVITTVFGANPIAAMSMLIALLALLVAYKAVSRRDGK